MAALLQQPTVTEQYMDFRGENTGTWQDGVIKPDGEQEMPNGTRVTWSKADVAPTREQRLKAKRDFLDLAKTAAIKLGGTGFTREQMHERR